jgi:hypothetical protein
MSAYAGWALHKAVHARLRADAATEGYRVIYNGAADYNYIVLGAEQTSVGVYNRTNAGSDDTVTLHFWADPGLSAEDDVRQMMANADTALRRAPAPDLTADGFTALGRPHLEMSQVMKDFDARLGREVMHGVMRYRYLISGGTY